MEKSLPYFLPADEKSISGNGLRRPWHSLLCRRLKIQQMSQELLLRCFFQRSAPGAQRSSTRQQRAGNAGNPAGARQPPGAEHPLLVIKASESPSEYVRNVREECPENRRLLNCLLLVEARVRRHQRIKR